MTEREVNDESLEQTRLSSDFITVYIGDQLFGIPVHLIHDVFTPHSITHVPLAPAEVAGVLNLRGRIVTAIDSRKCFELPPTQSDTARMAVGIERNGEAYGLVIDAVGENLSLESDRFEQNPAHLESKWRRFSRGIYRLDDDLMVVLDVEKLLEFGQVAPAAQAA
jgi:purine-binding chemotaxis protein CheW